VISLSSTQTLCGPLSMLASKHERWILSVDHR
jgi:hypothetical protein